MTTAPAVRVCSFNIRYDTPEDEYAWADRRPHVLEAIETIDPDLIGCQEALAHQYDDLRAGLPAYDWHGVGRCDGDREGEFVPVGWRRERFECLDTGAFWLSETPDEPSVGWDGALPRVATWVWLRDRGQATDADADANANDRYWVCTVHLDHRGEQARLQSARLLRQRASARLDDGETAVVMGDYNCTPGSPPYRKLTMGALADARKQAADVSGPVGTFHGFDGAPGDRIDAVFLPSAVDVTTYRTLPPRDGVPRSDHLPLVVEFALADTEGGR